MGARTRQPARILAGLTAVLVGLVAVGWWAVETWTDAPVASVEVATGEADISADSAGPAVAVSESGRRLRLHLTTPRRLVAGHRAPVDVALTDGRGRPLPDDTRLVVYAVVRAVGDTVPPVALDGPAARPMTAGELATTSLYLLPAGEPACDAVVADLRVRVALVDAQQSQVEQIRELQGPACDGTDVVPAPDTVNLDRPVRADDAGWYDDLDELMGQQPTRRHTISSEPARTSAPAPEPEPERAPEPEPEPERAPEPEPEPEPTDPEPTDPEPTDPEPTDPEPTDPEPTDPEPTDPEPTEPEPTDPEPTEPEPTNPEPRPSPSPPEDPKPSPTAQPDAAGGDEPADEA